MNIVSVLFAQGLGPVIAGSMENFLLGCFILLPVGIWCVLMVGWMIQGDLEAIVGFPAILLMVMLAYWTSTSPNTALTWLIFLSVTLSCVLYPVFQRIFEKHEVRSLDVEQVLEAMALLEMQPTNYLRRANLADLLQHLGQRELALGQLRAAVEQAPKTVLHDERRKIRIWEQYLGPSPERVVCGRCKREPELGELRCNHCQFEYVSARISAGTLHHKGFRRTFVSWMTGLLVLLGIFAIPSFGPTATIVGVPLLLLFGGFMVFRAFQTKRALA